MTIELAIFDCDGVLVDSEGISNEVLAAALTRAGLPTTPAESLAAHGGRLMRDVVDRAERRGVRLPADFIEAFERDRAREFERRLRAVPGAATAVTEVRDRGVRVCVASQGRPEKTELTLGLTGLRDLFAADALFSAEQVARGKPHPDLFLHAAASMAVAPERCAVIEDTTLGLEAARAAGMRAVAYVPEGDDPRQHRDGVTIIRSMAELAGALDLS